MNRLFLTLAIIFFLSCSNKDELIITIENNSNIEREYESVEIPLKDIINKFGDNIENLAVYENDVEIPSQLLSNTLLFQVTIEPNSKKQYILQPTDNKSEYKVKTYGRLVPERKDDWTWENNRIAFRVYGPALEATGEISNGIDVWLKSTENLIIDKWYKAGNNYHEDKGEGLDCYKVGRTLGAGALAPILNDKFVLGNNFISAILIESGPIRTSFLLNYAPYKINGVEVKESRLISLDANSNFNTITSTFAGDFETIEVGAGIILREGGDTKIFKQGVAYSEPENGNNGVTHIAVIMPEKCDVKNIDNHITATTKIDNNTPITYEAGAGWSKYRFANNLDWQNLVKDKISIINNPLIITMK